MAKVGEEVLKAIEMGEDREGSDDPAEAAFRLAGVGSQIPEVFKVAGFRPVEGSVKFELNLAWASDEADFQVVTVVPGFQLLPE